MSDRVVVKTRNMCDRIEMVGIETEGSSIKGGMRSLQRLAAANHGWAVYLLRRGAGCPLVLVGLSPELGGPCLIQPLLPISGLPDADSPFLEVAKLICEMSSRIPTAWLFLFPSSVWLS